MELAAAAPGQRGVGGAELLRGNGGRAADERRGTAADCHDWAMTHMGRNTSEEEDVHFSLRFCNSSNIGLRADACIGYKTQSCSRTQTMN